MPAQSEPAPVAAESRDISALQGEKIAPRAPTVKKGYVTDEGTGAAIIAKAEAPKMADMSAVEGGISEAAAENLTLEESAVSSEPSDTPQAKTAMAMDEKSPDAMREQREQGDAAMPKKKPQSRWLDQYLKKNSAENKMPEAAADPESEITEDETANEEAPEITAPPVMKQAASVQKSGEDSDAEEGPRYFKIEDGKLVEVTPDEAKEMSAADDEVESHSEKSAADSDAPKPESMKDGINEAPATEMPPVPAAPEYEFTSDISNMADDSTPMIATVMQEAARIKKAELRDQAYFEITEFALSEGRFESAKIAHDMIVQAELAYTAKSRIAVAYAQGGQASKAFKTISEVDEAELRDFMRLQVIEALIAPQNLPQGWQEKQ
jgi:hypothetical protein